MTMRIVTCRIRLCAHRCALDMKPRLASPTSSPKSCANRSNLYGQGRSNAFAILLRVAGSISNDVQESQVAIQCREVIRTRNGGPQLLQQCLSKFPERLALTDKHADASPLEIPVCWRVSQRKHVSLHRLRMLALFRACHWYDRLFDSRTKFARDACPFSPGQPHHVIFERVLHWIRRKRMLLDCFFWHLLL